MKYKFLRAKKIFISYRREDTDASCGRLYDYLKQSIDKEALFKDVIDIKTGSNIEEEINYYLNKSDIFFIIIGRNFTKLKSNNGKKRIFEDEDWVRLEISTAISLKKKIFPILVDNAKMPKKSELPKDLQELTNINSIGLRHDYWENDISIMLNSIENKIKPSINEIERQKLKNRKFECKIILVSIFSISSLMFGYEYFYDFKINLYFATFIMSFIIGVIIMIYRYKNEIN